MAFIRWIALACVGTGVVAIIGGILLAFVEARTYRNLSKEVSKLSQISSELTAKQVESDAATETASALAEVAQSFTELVRVTRGTAKSTPVIGLGLLLVFAGVGLTVVDYTIQGKTGSTPTTTVGPSSTGTTTTKP